MLGRQIQNWNEDVWMKNIVSIAEHVIYQKFSQVEHLKNALLETGDSLLIVSMIFDRLWGMSFDDYDDDIEGI